MSNREKSDDIAGVEFAGVESVGVESAGSEWAGVGGRQSLSGPSLDLQFALDKTLTARKGPTPAFTRGSSGTYFGPLVTIGGATLFGTTGIASGRASWQYDSDEGDNYQLSYTGTMWELRIQLAAAEDPTYHNAAAGSEWRPDQANWSGSGVDITTSGTFGIVRSAINEPRFDHDPVTLDCKGLLIEESRTNSIADSNAFNNWSMTNSTVASSSVANPEGSLSAWKVNEDMLLSIHAVTRAFTPVSGVTYTASVWLKAAENSFAFIGLVGGGFATFTLISVNLSTGAVTTATGNPVGAASVAYSNGWWRVSISQVATSSASSNIDVRLSRDGVFANRSYLGNGVNGIYCYGAQVETGSFPTSYIPTTTASVIRSADVCSISGSAFSGFYNPLEGTMVTSASANGFTTNNNAMSAIELGVGNVIRIINRVAQGNRLSAIVSGVTLTPASNYNSLNVVYKTAVAANASGADYVIDGTQIPDVFTGSALTADNLKFSGIASSTSNNTILSFRYYRKRLPVAKLQSLTV